MMNWEINTDKEEKNLIGSIFNTKTIIQAGGILVALFSLFVLYKTLTNDLSHIQKTIDRQTDVFSEVLRDNTKAINNNTEVLNSLTKD